MFCGVFGVLELLVTHEAELHATLDQIRFIRLAGLKHPTLRTLCDFSLSHMLN